MDTMHAIAMMRGLKIWRMPISIICGFFSGSTVEEAGEGACALGLKRSSIAMIEADAECRKIERCRTCWTWGMNPYKHQSL
jgi:hypothetical protein